MSVGVLLRSVRSGALALVAGAMAVAPLAGVAQAPRDGGASAARDALRTGDYGAAVDRFRRLVRAGEAGPDAHRGLVRALAATGRYEEAEEVARRGVDGAPGAELLNVLGEVLRTRGRRSEAMTAFERATAAGTSDALDARLNRAILLFRRGDREAALDAFDGFIDVYNRTATLTSRELTAVGTAVRYLGRRNPDLYRDALRAYDEAVAADSANLEARVRMGELFLEKFNGPDARSAFEAALAVNPSHPGALVGMARTLDFAGEPGAMERVRAALEVNPRFVPARVLLSRLHLEVGDFDAAEAEARRALEVNPSSLDALEALGAVRRVRGDTAAFVAAVERARRLNPRHPGVHRAAAEAVARHRRYREAVELAREAVRLDPEAWDAVGTLALNQLRIGAMDDGRENLERAFRGDPYNVWYKNTLDLLDRLDGFETLSSDHFVAAIPPAEADLLGPYALRVAEAAWSELAHRYGAVPATPVRLEVFGDHADFSVRTVGLTGMGALGVSFGPVVAMDAPSARSRGEFNWASALWHEVAHSFHMALSDHRVPRWFSEGLAVHDQRRAEAGWGHAPDDDFLRAYEAGRLHPPSRLNAGFVRPDYPRQVVFSYYEASLVFEMIEEEWGFGTIRALLRRFREGRTLAGAFRAELGMEPEAFDRRFDRWMRGRFETELAAVGGEDPGSDRAALEAMVAEDPRRFDVRLALGKALYSAGEDSAAVPHFEAAARLFPGYGGSDSPHWYLGRIHRARGDEEGAIRELAALRGVNETHWLGSLEEASAREEAGDTAGAAPPLERAVQIWPYEVDVHRRLARVHESEGRWSGAVRERRAVLALDPVGRAEALFHLARARHGAGDVEGARETVLRALEIAPGFEEALDLLLRVRAAAGEGRSR